MPDSDMMTESPVRSENLVQRETQATPSDGTAFQLSQCEKLVDELLKVNPDEAVILSLSADLKIPRSLDAVDRIAGVFEKLQFLMKNHREQTHVKTRNRPEKDAP